MKTPPAQHAAMLHSCLLPSSNSLSSQGLHGKRPSSKASEQSRAKGTTALGANDRGKPFAPLGTRRGSHHCLSPAGENTEAGAVGGADPSGASSPAACRGGAAETEITLVSSCSQDSSCTQGLAAGRCWLQSGSAGQTERPTHLVSLPCPAFLASSTHVAHHLPGI